MPNENAVALLETQCGNLWVSGFSVQGGGFFPGLENLVDCQSVAPYFMIYPRLSRYLKGRTQSGSARICSLTRTRYFDRNHSISGSCRCFYPSIRLKLCTNDSAYGSSQSNHADRNNENIVLHGLSSHSSKLVESCGSSALKVGQNGGATQHLDSL